MSKRTLDAYFKERQTPKWLRLMLPHNVTGIAMIGASLSTLVRPNSTVMQSVLALTQNFLSVTAWAIILGVCGFGLLLIRPRVNAFWYFVLSCPIFLLVLAFIQITLNSQTASGLSVILSIGFWAYGMIHALWLDEAGF